jgi:predicted nucleic acid-binding protein
LRAVSNSSVLIALSGIGQLSVLMRRFPDGILIPQAVWYEKARQVARRMNLPILGTLGLLIWAKRQGVIGNLQEQLDALRTVAKFRLSQQVYDEALRQVGELQ